MERHQYISKKGVKMCTCSAYRWPHKLDEGLCKDLYNATDGEADYRVEIMRDFDRTEAQAINSMRSK